MCVDDVAPEFSTGRGCNKVGLKTSDSEVGVNGKNQMLCTADFVKNSASAKHARYLLIEHASY